MKRLLGTNTKLEKDNGLAYLLTGLSLAPHGIGGHQVCDFATIPCMKACVLWFSGRTQSPGVRSAMIARKQLLFTDPARFHDMLNHEIRLHERNAFRYGLIPAVRLNVASDLDWSHVVRMHPGIRFYDYTKCIARIGRVDWPSNYELTYSLNDRSDLRAVNRLLSAGHNVAAVYSTRYLPQRGRCDALPSSWKLGTKTWPIVDGDKFDVRLRDLDGSGVIIGLRFKGSLNRRAQAMANGFCLTAQ